jgi:hypothetical protein
LGTLLTSTLHYGMLDPDGEILMRVTFDHRVLDGAAVAGLLEEMETVLSGDILHECADRRTVDSDQRIRSYFFLVSRKEGV